MAQSSQLLRVPACGSLARPASFIAFLVLGSAACTESDRVRVEGGSDAAMNPDASSDSGAAQVDASSDDGGMLVVDGGACNGGACGDADTACADADADGTCDVDDVCTGFDDDLDDDGDGTPDACDCDAANCAEDATCAPSNTGAVCTCDDGYTGSGTACTDINECAAAVNPCGTGVCSNEPGTYTCDCSYPEMLDVEPAPTCRAPRMLVLGDGGDHGMVARLSAEGFQVTDGGLYGAFTGAGLTREAFDTVIWLQGTDYGKIMGVAGEQAIVDFVEAGGGLVRTEWALWWAKDATGGNTLSAALMPGQAQDDQAYGKSAQWTVVQSAHPLARNLPAKFASVGAYTRLVLKPGSVVVVQNDVGQPAVSYTTRNGGCTVHVNDDLLYLRRVAGNTTAVIEPAVYQAYINAAYFSAYPSL